MIWSGPIWLGPIWLGADLTCYPKWQRPLIMSLCYLAINTANLNIALDTNSSISENKFPDLNISPLYSKS